MVILHGKCVLVGDCTVGKSAIAQTFQSDGTMFPKTYTMTTGVDLSQKLVHLPDKNTSVDIFLFDCAGNEVFGEMCKAHWNDIGLYAVVFDVTDSRSFGNAQHWINKLKQYLPENKSVPCVLIGNKADLENSRLVTTDEAQDFANENQLQYFECSAKNNEGVEAPFIWMLNKFNQMHEEDPESVQVMS